MKSTLKALVVLAFMTGWHIAAILSMKPTLPAPEAIQIVGPSETEIKEQVKSERATAIRRMENERRAKAYAAATRTVTRILATNCPRGSSRYAGLIAGAAIGSGLPSRLLAAVVVVESSCNPNADDHLGSVGLMQVNSKTWHRSVASLRDPETNIRIGTQVLAGYIRKYGVEEGLHHYNGYSEVHTHVYVQKVLEVSRGKNLQAAS